MRCVQDESMNAMTFAARIAGICALLVFLSAAVMCGAVLEGYSHREFPLAYLGASGVPGASAFNLFGFVVPGLLAFAAALPLRSRLPEAYWRVRIGARLIALSALAFAAQGLLPLNPDDVVAEANVLHASAWTLWWIAFVAGAGLLAIGGLGRRQTLLCAGVAIGVPALALTPWPGAMAAYAPRLAFAAWLMWMAATPWMRAVEKP
jgi:hypothetical membrane protein